MKTRANIITENVLYFTVCLFIALFLLGWTCGCESPTGVEKDVYKHPDKLPTYRIDVSVVGKYRYVNSIDVKIQYLYLDRDGTYCNFYIWNLDTDDEELNKFDGTIDTLSFGYWWLDRIGVLSFTNENDFTFKRSYEIHDSVLTMCNADDSLGCYNLARVD